MYKPRRLYLDRAALCSPEQTGIIFLLIRNNKPEAVSIENGKARIEMEQIDDRLLARLESYIVGDLGNWICGASDWSPLGRRSDLGLCLACGLIPGQLHHN